MTAKKMLFMLMVILLGHAALASAQSPSWDVAQNFSSKHNPNGPWRYYATGTGLAYGSDACGTNDATGCPVWQNGRPEPDYVGIVANNTGAVWIGPATQFVPPGYVMIDPQSQIGTITWTAPAAGKYSFQGSFLGIDTGQGTHYVHINILGQQKPVFDASICCYGQSFPFAFQAKLFAGEAVAFSVMSGSDYHNIGTGLSLQISAVPSN